ncbi:unnamed protein product [Brachionus calyciflorus]|uniref:Cyclin-Q n=1 Tax=Brachionus calyciflorus TaxID=104777 RepID=A0A813M416_9BILA|nr:unnamed protein product [Brachionus calyciflorus]
MSYDEECLKKFTDLKEIAKQTNSLDNLKSKINVSNKDDERNFDEFKIKFKVCRFMLISGIKLKLEDLTLATSTSIFQKFFKSCKLTDFDPYLVATASIYLACKVEEQEIKLRDIINVCYRTLHPDMEILNVDDKYWSIRKSVIQIELFIVRVLEFRVDFEHPHKYLLVYLDSLRHWIPLEKRISAPIPETSWHILKDLLHSDLLIRFRAQDIAITLIYFVCLCYGTQIPFNDIAKKTWWKALDDKITKTLIHEIMGEILNIYDFENKIGDIVKMVEINSNDNNLKFENVKKFFLHGLELNDLDIDSACEKFSNSDEIVKTAIEHSFRTFIVQNMDKIEFENLKKIVDLSISAAQKKLCLPTTPIHMLNDMLSTLTIEKCSEIFCYLEDSSHIWKSELFYQSVKNYLLRMCNDLLKRLSKSQNTVFSGRIHLFLAKLFPLNEKSGLNLMSHFSDNFTRYTNNPEAFEEAINKNKMDVMETDEDDKISSHAMPIDYNLYTKFWSLQEIFCKPNTCYDKHTWRIFTNNANEVFEALKSYKLEDIKDEGTSKMDEYDDMNLYFSKYLTSEKLLDLQLNDSNFRRQILLQFLILFQYLGADIKFKTNSQVLNEEQSAWIKSATKKVTDLIKETPPQGSKFSNGVRHILEREEIWNKWKNEGCPNYVKEKKQIQVPSKTPTKRPKPLSSDFLLKSTTKKAFISDQSVISKLCNVNHENLEVCKDPNRQFLPSLKEFFEDAIDQMDPANQVEKQYYLINQTDWAWKALRLLAKRSPYYFMQNQNVKTISEYLEAICGKLKKDFNVEQQAEMQQIQKSETEGDKNGDENKDENKDANTLDDNEDTQGNEDEVQFDEDQAQPASIKQENEDEEEQMESEEIKPSESKEKPLEENVTEPLKEFKTQDSVKFIDSELINFVVENIIDEEELQKLVSNLTKNVSDKISVDDSQEIKVKYKKMLQTWTEFDDRKDLSSILIDELKSIGKDDLANQVETKLK